MKITLEMYDHKYTFEAPQDDFGADELKEIFSRLMVQAGFSPSVLWLADGGYFECEYKEDK